MSDGILDPILAECADRQLYLADVYAPFFVASYACHRFNIMNQRRQVYWENKRIPNNRIHTLFVSPPGFMKTFYLTNMGGGENAIFDGTGTDMCFKESMTEASFIGSYGGNGRGNAYKIEGVAEQHKEGVIVVDEFSAILNALKAQFNGQFEPQLLAALDHGNIQKDLASGSIEYKTMMTVWSGIQPTRFDMTAGLGRRFNYLLFIPTERDNDILRTLKRSARGMKANTMEIKRLHNKIRDFNDGMNIISKVEFAEEIDDYYDYNKLYNYETSIFDKLALGYYLAKNGPEKNVCVELDEGMKALFERQKSWRTTLQQGVDFAMISNVITKYGGMIHQSELANECMIYGWNAAQVGRLVRTMKDNGLLRGVGKKIELIK